jgi:hypothetical protein
VSVLDEIAAMASLTPDYWGGSDDEPPTSAAIDLALETCAALEAVGVSVVRAGAYNDGGIVLYIDDRHIDIYNDGDNDAPGPTPVVCRTRADGQREYVSTSADPAAIAALVTSGAP